MMNGPRGEQRPGQLMRGSGLAQDICRPCRDSGTIIAAHPALKRWAMLFRPSGAGVLAVDDKGASLAALSG